MLVLGALDYDPIVRIDIGPLSISPHGIGIAVGILAGAWLMRPAARAQGISDELLRACIVAVVGVFFAVTDVQNRRIRAWGAEDPPPVWRRTRAVWELSHGVRAALFTAATALLGAALALSW